MTMKRELPNQLGRPVLGGGHELLGLASGVGTDNHTGHLASESDARVQEVDVIHAAGIDVDVELLGLVSYNGSRMKSDGYKTDVVGLTVAVEVHIRIRSRIRSKVGAKGGGCRGCRVELAMAEDKQPLVNCRGTIAAADNIVDNVERADHIHDDNLSDKARLVSKAKHGQLGLSAVIGHSD